MTRDTKRVQAIRELLAAEQEHDQNHAEQLAAAVDAAAAELEKRRANAGLHQPPPSGPPAAG